MKNDNSLLKEKLKIASKIIPRGRKSFLNPNFIKLVLKDIDNFMKKTK